MHAIIVGAGLAGLVCARSLQQAGVTTTIYEASDGVGGRVRTDVVDGLQLDRGFQVLFDAYPAAQRWFDYGALRLQPFDPGAVIVDAQQRSVVTDPLRDPADAWAAIWAPAVSTIDKLRILALRRYVASRPFAALQSLPDTTAREFLTEYGFSAATIERFFVPFYGGIFLDRGLTTSAKCLLYDYKMLAMGATVLPAAGMGALPAQLAAGFQPGNEIHLQQPVVALERDGGRVCGVRLADGSVRAADVVVLATAAPAAAALAGDTEVSSGIGTTTLYWAGSAALPMRRKIWLHARPDAYVNSATLLTAVAPSYAPAGQQLLSASVVGVPSDDDETVYMRAEADLVRLLGVDVRALGYRRVRVYRIPYAQFAQPAGIHPHLPAARTDQPGLYRAGEYTVASSINGAMLSGERAAKAILSAR
jgi:phytoene dehydrogenase-like protein